MTGTRPAEILRQLEQSGSPDADLLTRFVAARDSDAFAELVRRHGSLVLGVCRRVTGHPQDAEDAFQATFLVLAKKAGTLRNPALLGNWLYGVAFRVAWRARRSARRRKAREVTVADLPEPLAPFVPTATSGIQPILDEELAALAACYRDAIVLCDLRGVSREEAARTLGVPEGTVSSRLANGRKKLAARLTKRGVALSAAALPAAVADVQAAPGVPNELITKTCVLVADWAAGGAVPRPLGRLAEGGLAVRKTLMLGAVMVVSVAGAVFAAQPGNAPPTDPPKPPGVVAKPEPLPEQKPDPKVKAAAFASAPRLVTAWDVPIVNVHSLVWNSDGSSLAVDGTVPGEKQSQRSLIYLLKYPEGSKAEERVRTLLPRGEYFVGFSSDGKHVITDLREFALLSGYHKLFFWDAGKATAARGAPDEIALTLGNKAKIRTVEFDGAALRTYSFAPDDRSFRAVRVERNSDSQPIKMDVVEVDTFTGIIGKSLLELEHAKGVLYPSGKRIGVLDKNFTKLTIYDVDRGEKRSEFNIPPQTVAIDPNISPPDVRMAFSRDEQRTVISIGVGQTFVINTETGEALPALEGIANAITHPSKQSFSGDGRYLVLGGQEEAKPAKKVGRGEGFGPGQGFTPERPRGFLTVWDTNTGKIVKTWSRAPSYWYYRAAFSPVRPLLAIPEPNGDDETRFGFWNFAAEAAKK